MADATRDCRKKAFRGILVVETTGMVNGSIPIKMRRIMSTKTYDTPGKARGQLTALRKDCNPNAVIDAYTEEATEWTRID